MTIVSTHTDPEALRLVVVAEFSASVERVWELWSDPRQLERWWGPPTWPATFERHEFVVGGRSNYFMTGPDGEKARGWWKATLIEAPNRFEFDDGFADEQGEPDPAMGATHETVTIDRVGDTTRMTIVTDFANLEQLEQMTAMGMEEGMALAIGQIDALLAE